ncbi:unnamed protein product [Zymoseptoria tritici ST99CH_1E4]|uniref:Amino-acid acetyltransferase, mitochondrial n=1 Tax=Zymoseptoria tritici ST99CH_1E4 TaxID=1276532 RepID=A0A2H1GCI8_ZYMTR|nr:unnamed protein product [Zymoseptoria tritici ST99CH_1E4]
MNSLAAGKVISGNTKSNILKCTRRYSNHSASTGNGNGAHLARAEDTETQRDFIVNVLNVTPTRRDAKQYLARFEVKSKIASQDERNARHRRDQDRVDRMGVNLGGLYAPARAIANTPQFTQQEAVKEQTATVPEQQLHIALVCLRAADGIDDETLDGLAVTLSQLVKLDMRIVLVLASDNPMDEFIKINRTPVDIKPIRNAFAKQASRICDALERHSPKGGRSVPNALEQVHEGEDLGVAIPELIADPLQRGIIPIVPSMAYTLSGKLLPVPTSEVMTGLTKFLSGLDNVSGKQKAAPSPETASLDRIIILDAIGGIPSKDRGDGAHVFINLQQEFDKISQELSEYAARKNNGTASRLTVYDQHRANMDLIRRCLTLLPTSSSALIVTPNEAASASRRSTAPTLGAGTRRQKNPLIHNLLTNKPLISSSLPVSRFTQHSPSTPTRAQLSTVLRLGMPLTIVPPPPSPLGWQLPLPSGTTSLDLTTDPRIDLPRLIHLIEDSFRRKLNVPHYLSRISSRLAGLIIAGQYEGAAILTWEMPPGVNDPSRLVPYLDKFAVLQTSQGSSGVADIVFQAMVRSGFPEGVCWRSRVGNPVNKWYFERAEGSWRVEGTEWVMFWTGKGVVEDQQRWDDYVAVCRSIPASLEPVRK